MCAGAAESGGGHWGQVPLHVLYLGKKCPYSGMKVPYFHRIEMPFLQNLSALFGQCPLTFEVLPQPLGVWREGGGGKCPVVSKCKYCVDFEPLVLALTMLKLKKSMFSKLWYFYNFSALPKGPRQCTSDNAGLHPRI